MIQSCVLSWGRAESISWQLLCLHSGEAHSAILGSVFIFPYQACHTSCLHCSVWKKHLSYHLCWTERSYFGHFFFKSYIRTDCTLADCHARDTCCKFWVSLISDGHWISMIPRLTKKGPLAINIVTLQVLLIVKQLGCPGSKGHVKITSHILEDVDKTQWSNNVNSLLVLLHSSERHTRKHSWWYQFPLSMYRYDSLYKIYQRTFTNQDATVNIYKFS